MLTITLVVVDGRLVGKTFSDTWNLHTLLEMMNTTSLPYHKNGSGLRNIRSAFGTDFTFKVDTKGTPQAVSDEEYNAMTFTDGTVLAA